MSASRVVSVELSVGNVAKFIGAAGAIVSVAWWLFDANLSHEKAKANEESIGALAKEEEFRQMLWGENYRERIRSVLESEEP